MSNRLHFILYTAEMKEGDKTVPIEGNITKLINWKEDTLDQVLFWLKTDIKLESGIEVDNIIIKQITELSRV
jgi:hypothetical protein